MTTNNQTKDDLENQQLTQEQQDYIHHFEKIYHSNYKQITYLENSIRYLQIIAIFAGLLFLIFLTTVLVLDKRVLYSFIYSSIPLIIGVITLALTINFFLNLTVIYNEGTSLASWMSYFSINLAAGNLIVFIILFTLRIENIITMQWKIITIPLYVIIGISLFYFIFMMPAFIDKESYSDIVMLATLILNMLIFMILLNSRLDNSYLLAYTMIFIPIWITNTVFFIHQIYSLIKFCEDKSDYFNNAVNLAVNTIVTIASVVIATILDKLIVANYVIPCCLLILAYLIMFTERLLNQFNVNLFEKKE